MSPAIIDPDHYSDDSNDERPQPRSSLSQFSSSLQPVCPATTVEDDTYDLICIGFGPASLAIAVALHDATEADPSFQPRVKFLERQHQFGWHAGMLLPGTKMQISFVKDLATLRNPRSKFTFLNYLKEKGRLAHFTNLDTFLPLRIEFEDYLRWAANHFTHAVEYSANVRHVRPVPKAVGGKCERLEVVSADARTGQKKRFTSKNVVVAIGGRPTIPPVFSLELERIIHSSQYHHQISSLLPSPTESYEIAVVGSGQSAAEVFNDLHSRYPSAQTRMIIRDAALRPSDDSPFVNEIFDPEAVEEFYSQPEYLRAGTIQRNKATNYSVVRLHLLEKIYEDLYHQAIHEPNRKQWQRQILASREIIAVDELKQSKRINLTLQNKHPKTGDSEVESLAADAVVLATGYKRDMHMDILQDCQGINGAHKGGWQAGRDYQVKLNRKLVASDVGIWLQGCNEETHGLSDSLLSILASRSGDLVRSIFGRQNASVVSIR